MGVQAEIKLRTGLGRPLSISEVDVNFSNINSVLATKLDESSYTANDILTKLKTVDGTGSGLDADTLDGLSPASANTASTLVLRDSSGNFSAGTITAELNGNAATVTNGLYSNVAYTNPSWLTITTLNNLTLTGVPVAPTATAGTNTTQLATTAFVRTAVTNATGSLGTMSTQNANSVAIIGGSLSGVTLTTTGNTNTINGNIVGSNSVGTRTIEAVSTGVPASSRGNNGDIIYQY